MQLQRSIINRFPRIKEALRPIYYFMQGLPPISNSRISSEVIRNLIRKPNPIILEIGCNDGGHTLWLNEIFESPTIYCFEPDPRAIVRFGERVGNRSNIHLNKIALSDRNGEVSFFPSDGDRPAHDAEGTPAMPEGWDLSGSIRRPKNHLKKVSWVRFGRTISVKTKTLDTWCDENGIEAIDFIWMDVQGAELDVFRGGKRALSNTRYIYTEYSNSELYEGQAKLRELIRYLNCYSVVTRYPDDLLLKNRIHIH
ncbi:MAG: FkbM family methyltransferase [Verrucomicrobiota bacterium]